jgi:hypothetical protein
MAVAQTCTECCRVVCSGSAIECMVGCAYAGGGGCHIQYLVATISSVGVAASAVISVACAANAQWSCNEHSLATC